MLYRQLRFQFILNLVKYYNTFTNLDFIENHKFTLYINQRVIVLEGD